MAASPTQALERIDSLDMIRGFALFGIFLVNIPLFQYPKLIADTNLLSYELSSMDQWIRIFFDVFIEAKFFAIFSFMFGLGFYIFMNRAEEKGKHIYRLFFRRLLILALLGLIHLIFFWYGDILLQYAFAGMLLILFYKRKAKTIIIWITTMLVLLVGLLAFSFTISNEVLEREIAEQQLLGAGKVEEAIDVYQHGSYVDWLKYRFIHEVIPVVTNLPASAITALFMFLLGLYAGKRGIFTDIKAHLPFIKRTWVISLFASLPISLLIISIHLGLIDLGVKNQHAIQTFITVSGFSLSLFYTSSILLLLQKAVWIKWLQPFSYAGRMALTNYMAQTIVGVGIFTGLGLFGTKNLALGVMICLVVFPLQIIFSAYWLQKFHYGPLEWVWRSLTYGKIQSMRRIENEENI